MWERSVERELCGRRVGNNVSFWPHQNRLACATHSSISPCPAGLNQASIPSTTLPNSTFSLLLLLTPCNSLLSPSILSLHNSSSRCTSSS